MASNTYEWTTEYSTYANSSNAGPCTARGGGYNGSNCYTSNRGGNNATVSYKSTTFRPTLYM